MSSQLKVRCAGCDKVFDIPSEYCGRKVRCPRCSTVFMVGGKPVGQTAESQSHPPEPILASPVDETPLIADSVSTSEFPGPMSSGEVDPFGDLGDASSVVANVAPATRSISRREAVEIGKRKASKSAGELNETDQRVQSAGLFLIFLPLISSVLPLFGFQLRRLASSGEFAPLAASFLGLIGAGCIGYAHRNRGDALMMGGGAAAFVVVTGGLGFFLLVGMASDPFDEVANQNARHQMNQDFGQIQPGNAGRIQPRMAGRLQPGGAFPEVRRAPRLNDENSARALPENPFRRNVEDEAADRKKRQAAAKKRRDEQRERAAEAEARTRQEMQKLMERMEDVADQVANAPAEGNRFPADRANERRGTSPFVQPAEGGASSNSDNPFGAGATTVKPKSNFGPRPTIVESIPSGSRRGAARVEVHRRWSSGSIAFSRARSSDGLAGGLKVSNAIGTKHRTGSLFFSLDPIQGVEGIRLGGPVFIPINAGQTPFENAIVVPDGKRIAGFNLALDGGNIVGIQGLFIDSQSKDINDVGPAMGHWLGIETPDIRPILASAESKVHGFVCYRNASKTTGFALVFK